MLGTNGFKNLLIKCDGYVCRIEYNEDYVILHLREIDKFSKEVFISMQYQLEDWAAFIRAMGHEYIWAAVPENDTKVRRLLSGLKFRYVSQQDDLTVYRYGV